MEENKIKVSVIMPVYKVEEYVGKAIESIQAQTLKDWEFLIVDDGTPVSYTHLTLPTICSVRRMKESM